jgi:hypothetical protein
MLCSNCGKGYKEEYDFCPECGNPINKAENATGLEGEKTGTNIPPEKTKANEVVEMPDGTGTQKIAGNVTGRGKIVLALIMGCLFSGVLGYGGGRGNGYREGYQKGVIAESAESFAKVQLLIDSMDGVVACASDFAAKVDAWKNTGLYVYPAYVYLERQRYQATLNSAANLGAAMRNYWDMKNNLSKK